LKNLTGLVFFVKEQVKTRWVLGLRALFVAERETTPTPEIYYVVNVKAPAGRPTGFPAPGAKEKDSQKGVTYDARIKYGFETKSTARFRRNTIH